jgi:hypothetical protein
MASIREMLLYGFSAMVVIICGKLAAPGLAGVPIIGQPIANLFAFV